MLTTIHCSAGYSPERIMLGQRAHSRRHAGQNGHRFLLDLSCLQHAGHGHDIIHPHSTAYAHSEGCCGPSQRRVYLYRRHRRRVCGDLFDYDAHLRYPYRPQGSESTLVGGPDDFGIGELIHHPISSCAG
jgi:hypothetical protein